MTVNGTKWSARIPDAVEGAMTIGILPDKGRLKNMDISIFGIGVNNALADFDI